MQKKVIIFDFDGTIADSLEEVIEIANSLAEKFSFRPVSLEELKELKNLSLFQVARKRGISKWKLFLVFWFGKQKFKEVVNKVRPFPEMVDVIRNLKERGYKLGILTFNSVFSVESFLKKNNLEYFDFIVSANAVLGKARAIQKTIQKRKLDPKDIVYVGDEIRDIVAARKAGVDSMAVCWGYNSRSSLLANNPTCLADKPEEILDILNCHSERSVAK